MGQISTVEYLGDLRTKAVHLESGSEIFTDAPKDNKGKWIIIPEGYLRFEFISISQITILIKRKNF